MEDGRRRPLASCRAARGGHPIAIIWEKHWQASMFNLV
ncbi:hypothetical protein CSC42_0121 [Pseudomonas aeruginosa]|nr:hypothetical protein CSC42_0121 [Pseudomonas aeruginosa]